MIKKITLTALLCFTVFSSLMAQQQRSCATMENLQLRMEKNPAIALKMAEIEVFTQQKIKSRDKSRIDGSIITIPVVVHVLYRNSTENISEAQILSQIDVLNEDFRRMNSDANNTWPQAADMEIQFCMATVDPNGNPTNAITRKQVTRRDWGVDDDMKSSSTGGVDPWNTSEYLNMWIVPQMLYQGNTILGYAQFPGGDPDTDGLVMCYNYFGRVGTLDPSFNLGRTTTHEIGHFFNLRHIWGDGPCGQDDFVSDTPESDDANYGCTPNHISCGSVDMVQNYMDYSDDVCMNLFTQGQKSRMRAVLEPGGFRRSLALSDKCGTVTTPTCDDGVQNGNETGVDCGGSCDPCQTSSNCTGTVVSNFPYSESFEGNIGAWTQSTSDNINWTVDANGTPSSGTGPSSASDGSFYIFVEASDPNYPNKQAIINSPCFDLTGVTEATFDFMYHMNGTNNLGSISLQASTDNSTWTTLWSQTSDQPDSWQSVSVDLDAYTGEVVKLRFNRVTGTTWQADVAIDDVNISTGGGTIDPPPGCSNINLSITFDNYPEETRWEIVNSSGGVEFSGGPYSAQADGSTLNLTGCIDNGCYTLVFYDSYGDGMCCSFGNGSYTLTNTDTGTVLATGGSFGSTQSNNFCLGGANRMDTSDVVSKVSVPENTFDIVLYPNPVKSGLLNITTTASDISYTISNMLGQEVSKGKTTGKAIDVSRLGKGVYIINLQAGDKQVTKHFIKE